jgi:hypothetical protein
MARLGIGHICKVVVSNPRITGRRVSKLRCDTRAFITHMDE